MLFDNLEGTAASGSKDAAVSEGARAAAARALPLFSQRQSPALTPGYISCTKPGQQMFGERNL